MLFSPGSSAAPWKNIRERQAAESQTLMQEQLPDFFFAPRKGFAFLRHSLVDLLTAVVVLSGAPLLKPAWDPRAAVYLLEDIVRNQFPATCQVGPAHLPSHLRLRTVGR